MENFMDTINNEERMNQQPVESEQAAMVNVCDIRFRNGAKIYFFDPDGLDLHEGDHVIIDTARGAEFGYCAGGNHTVSEKEVVAPLRKVLRLATPQDERINEENRAKEQKAFAVCQQKIEEHKLDMQLVSAECAFDGSKILFFFTADERVDFRELVKNLASIFRTRIELRQIGVRDKAKMVGGLGICGRPFCCKQFLDDFHPVSIKMAKTQNLSLNPTKISGTCGRLMCCLKYEQDAYEDLIKTSPKAESLVDTPDGRGTVTDVNLLRQCVHVRMEDHPDTIGCYHNCDICVLRNGKAKKNDPPIPKDLAPISGSGRSAPRTAPEPAEEERKPLLDSIIIKSMPEDIPAVEAPVVPEGGNEPRRRSRNRRRNNPAKQPAGEKPAQDVKQPEPARAPKAAQDKPQKRNDPTAAKSSGNRSNNRRPRNRRPKNSGSPKSE